MDAYWQLPHVFLVLLYIVEYRTGINKAKFNLIQANRVLIYIYKLR